jgi:hypothetical protein
MLVPVLGVGPCGVCGHDITSGSAFINIGPTDLNVPDKPKYVRWVPVDEDIHGWSPFVTMHPACYAQQEGIERLLRLVDESHRLLRTHNQRPSIQGLPR